jgi:hypothetical protein
MKADRAERRAAMTVDVFENFHDADEQLNFGQST